MEHKLCAKIPYVLFYANNYVTKFINAVVKTPTHSHTGTSARTQTNTGPLPLYLGLHLPSVGREILLYDLLFSSSVALDKYQNRNIPLPPAFFQLPHWMEVQTYETVDNNCKIYVFSVHVLGPHKSNYTKNYKNNSKQRHNLLIMTTSCLSRPVFEYIGVQLPFSY